MINDFKKPLFTLLTIGMLATACAGGDLLEEAKPVIEIAPIVNSDETPTTETACSSTPLSSGTAMLSTGSTTSGAATTDCCKNNIDDDKDGSLDCEDSDCTQNSACAVALEMPVVVDADGDSFGADVDCADDNPAVHPGVEENTFTNNGGRHANRLDDDCDGEIDEPGLCDCDDLKGFAIPGENEKAEAKQSKSKKNKKPGDSAGSIRMLTSTSAGTSSEDYVEDYITDGYASEADAPDMKNNHMGKGHGAKRFKKMCMNRIDEFKVMPGFDCKKIRKGKGPVKQKNPNRGEGSDVDDDNHIDDIDDVDDEEEVEQQDFISTFKFHYKLLNKANSDIELIDRWNAVTTRLDFKKGDTSKYLECKIADMAVLGDTKNTTDSQNIELPLGLSVTVSTTVGASFDLYFNPAYSGVFEKCRGSFADIAEYMDYAVKENVTGFSLSLNNKPAVSMGIESLAMSVAYNSTPSDFVKTYDNPYVMAYLNDSLITTGFPNSNETCAAPNVAYGFSKDTEAVSGAFSFFNLFQWDSGISNRADGTGSKNAIPYYAVSPKLVFTREDMAVAVSATGAAPLTTLTGISIMSTDKDFRWAFAEGSACEDKRRVTVFDGLASNQTRKAMYYTSAISEAEILSGGTLSLNDCSSELCPGVDLTNITVIGIKTWADDATGKFKHYKLTKTDTKLESSGIKIEEADGKATEYETVKTDF